MISPRLLRAKDAYLYLGFSRQTFNKKVKPYVTGIKDGSRMLLYDKVELDRWVDHYKECNGRPPERKGGLKWQEDATGSNLKKGKAHRIGISKGLSLEMKYEKALAQATGKLPKQSSQKNLNT